MVEKLKELEFSNLSQEETDGILTEMLSLNDDDIKECVYLIIDSVNYEDTDNENIENLSVFYKTVFNNEKVKGVMQDILEEYEKNI